MPGQIEAYPTIKNLDVTHIQLEPPNEYSLAKDVFEILTGVSGSAISVGGKITAGTIIYTGHESLEQSIANKLFSIGSLSLTILDFSLIPLGYLYKLYKKEPAPFNRENNIKWSLAGLTLALAIISLAAPVTAQIISFITAGLAVVVGVIAIIRYFYDYKITGEKLQAAIHKVESLTQKVREDMQEINELQNKIRLLDSHTNQNMLNPLIITLATTYQRYYRHCEKLKSTYVLKNSLEREFIRQKSPVELVANSLKFVLAGVVLVGTVLSLNPATLMFGMGLLASVAIFSFAMIVAKKIIQIVKKRKERHLEKQRNRHIEIQLDSTVALMQAFKAQPAVAPTSRAMTRSEKIAKPINVPDWRSRLYAATDSETKPLLAEHSNSEEANEDPQNEIAALTRR